jgi:hypothetical protein
MDSPSRNPLLSREDISSEEDDNLSQDSLHETILERNNYIATSRSSSTAATHKDSHKRRNASAPTDQYNFAYIVFYILGM